MALNEPRLGVCFNAENFYFAVHSGGDNPAGIERIGQLSFPSSVARSIRNGVPEICKGIASFAQRTAKTYGIKTVHIATMPDLECWTMVPKIAFDDAAEREAQIALLMYGVDRSNIEVNWFDPSNADYKMLLLRQHNVSNAFRKVFESIPNMELVSDFELGFRWTAISNQSGSFLLIRCLKGVISLSSFILGKLRGAIHISFDHYDDLPYWWTFYASKISWINGVHDNLLIFGENSNLVMQELGQLWDKDQRMNVLETPKDMFIDVAEETYGFPLHQAFPAIMASLAV